MASFNIQPFNPSPNLEADYFSNSITPNSNPLVYNLQAFIPQVNVDGSQNQLVGAIINEISNTISQPIGTVKQLVNPYKAGTPKNLVDQKFPGSDDRLGEKPHAFAIDTTLNNSFEESDFWSDRMPGYKTSYMGYLNKGKVVENIMFNKDDFNGYKTGIANNYSFPRCIISVGQKKNVITTKIMGKDGTIKEFVGMDDFEVKLEVTIFGKNGQYPYEDVNNLTQYLIYKQPIPVTCDYLNQIFGINYLIIKDYDINMEAGSISQQHVTITALSDKLYDDDLFSPYENEIKIV